MSASGERAYEQCAFPLSQSGSMSGERIEIVKKSLEYIVTELKPFDFLGNTEPKGVSETEWRYAYACGACLG